MTEGDGTGAEPRRAPRSNRLGWLALICAVIGAVVAEFSFGDFLYDTQSSNLTAAARLLLVVGSTSALVLLLLSGLQRFLVSGAKTGEQARPAPLSRTNSLIPLVRGILFAVVAIIGLLVALSEAGVNIGPLLASAGVLGVAIGLGAQSLMRDILAGVFFVAEDSFRIGEYVEIGQLRGTVERVSLRSMKVRHHRGALHTIPYGQILSITNYSRDWVIVKFELLVPHDTDVMKLKKVVKQVSADIAEVPEFAPFMLEPLKSQGVDSVDLFGLTVRLKFMAVPGEQFTMRREMLRRLTSAFEANGIRLARRSVQVESSDGGTIPAGAAELDDEPGSGMASGPTPPHHPSPSGS